MDVRARNGLLISAVLVAATAVSNVITTGVATAATDEAQVRAVLEAMNGLYNASDFNAFASHVCADMLRANDFQTGWYASRRADGATQITINSVAVSGNGAVANVRFQAAKHADARTFDVEFLREGAAWKACRYHPTRSV